MTVLVLSNFKSWGIQLHISKWTNVFYYLVYMYFLISPQSRTEIMSLDCTFHILKVTIIISQFKHVPVVPKEDDAIKIIIRGKIIHQL